MRSAPAVLMVLVCLACGGGPTPPPPGQLPCEKWCSGCCAPDGTCNAGFASAACGSSGKACAACAPSTSCEDQVCVPLPRDAGTPDAGTADAGPALAVTLRWRYAARGVCSANAVTDDAYVECAATRPVAEGRVQGLWYDNYFGCALGRDGGAASIDCSHNCQDSMGYCAGPDGGLGRQRLVLSCFEVRGVAQLSICDWQPPTQ